MLFNGIQYAIFLSAVTVVYFAIPRTWRWLVLLVASFVFYMWWRPIYVLLLLYSIVVGYGCGLAVHAAPTVRLRRLALAAAVVLNLGVLAFFKYWNLIVDSASAVASFLLGSPIANGRIDILLPIGISFFTFVSMAYVVDVYRGKHPPERDFLRFALFKSFFPQLVAGPIERADHLLPQVKAEHAFDADRIVGGLQVLFWGLFKKVVIADRLAIYVDAIYGNVGNHNGVTYLLATYAFAFQIYCDFSGYTDMAIGSARIFGIDLMKNFERPYFATSLQEFWRRWHISLSTWLRDYLYIPLGGSRHGEARTYISLFVTMLLGGIWHGAAYTFVIWGAFHGALLALSHAMRPLWGRLADALPLPRRLRRGLGIFVTFHLVCLGWVFFRASSFRDAGEIIGRVFTDWGMPFLDHATLANAAFGLVILLGVQFVQERRGSVRLAIAGLPAPVRWACWYALVFSVVLFGVSEGGAQFIYFQF